MTASSPVESTVEVAVDEISLTEWNKEFLARFKTFRPRLLTPEYVFNRRNSHLDIDKPEKPPRQKFDPRSKTADKNRQKVLARKVAKLAAEQQNQQPGEENVNLEQVIQ